MSTSRTAKGEILVEGLADWVYVSWALQAVKSHSEPGDDCASWRERTILLIRELLEEGLVEIGDVRNGVHIPWRSSVHASLERVRREWVAEWGDTVPTPGAIGWLCNTPAGDALARAILAQDVWGADE